MTKVQNQENPDRPITVSECERKHGSTKFVYGLIFTLVLTFIGVVTACTVVASTSKNQSHAAQEEFRIFKSGHSSETVNIKETLLRLEVEIKDQRRMIEDIWHKNGGAFSHDKYNVK